MSQAPNPDKALWEKGDFTEIAAYMRESGGGLASTLPASPGVRVLDLGCGDGTTALPLARTGADVTGIDIARNLVLAGNRRAAAEGLGDRLRFLEGDACRLEGIADASFDMTVSIFGAMFAPRPHDVAKEMVRVTKPGGRIFMGNWIPEDPTSFVSKLLRLCATYAPPPPPGFVSPMLWGVQEHIVERFGGAGVLPRQITMEKDTFVFASPERSAADWADALCRYYGPTMTAVDAAAKAGKADELRALVVALAKAEDRGGGKGVRIPATYMRVTVNV